MEQRVQIGEAFKTGWNLFRQHLRLFLPIMLVVSIVQYVPGMLLDQVGEEAAGRFPILALRALIVLLSIIVELGLIRIALLALRSQPFAISDLFGAARHILTYILASIAIGMATAAGLLLLILPGLYLFLRLQFYGYMIVDRNLGVLDALRESWRITRGHVLQLFLFALAAVVLNLLGVVVLFVGLLVTIPITTIATAYIYRQLALPAAGESESPPSSAS